ncbi:transmembrane protein 256 homolog isoform X2 [Fopius arisanus]|uniref:Transmembrane protein 256 homolog isoform X2 n=1 Tax=Fopius arisanus TaxID=64838 RepID=A0A9R1T6Y8_9HYME|nr:PREDICTED: transmembrane protein 256 homolog isoform X2 [Fopius arisanus]
MGVSDTLNYVLFSNPVSSGAGSFAKTAASAVINYSGLKPRVEYKMVPPEPLWKLAAASGPYLKLAGLSGATAVILGAYGAHRKYKDDQLKQVFETANRYHFYHSLAMVGLVMCRAPILTAALWMSGSLMFCGSCYYYAFTGDKRFSKITPFGGTCFILGWLTMCI